MQKKYIGALAVLTFTLIFWIYRSNLCVGNEVIEINSSAGIKLLRSRYQYAKVDYLLQPSKSASVCTKAPRLVIIVTSYAGHVELRSAHRRAMPADELEPFNVTRVFLLARLPPGEKSITQEAINSENEIFGDILQGNFTENYRNLTHKHLMGLRWAATACKNASYVLKVDDDTVFRLDKTFELLSTLDNRNKDNLLFGYMLNGTIPKRAKQNKWYVSLDEFERNIYPPYVSGWYYITTPKVAGRLVEESVYHPFFWIDDVFITGILAESLGIKMQNVPKGFWMEYYEIVECCMKHMIEKNIKCDFAVGPNGNRHNLIVEFNEALKECDKRKYCLIKSGEKPLCVSERERAIFSEGVGEIKEIDAIHHNSDSSQKVYFIKRVPLHPNQ